MIQNPFLLKCFMRLNKYNFANVECSVSRKKKYFKHLQLMRRAKKLAIDHVQDYRSAATNVTTSPTIRINSTVFEDKCPTKKSTGYR